MKKKGKFRAAALLVFAGVMLILSLSAWTAVSVMDRITGYTGDREEVERFASHSRETGFGGASESEGLPQCILILGCGLRADGTPSAMLRDRLDAGIALYRAGAAPKLLMSGDNGQIEYNEPICMLNYALEAGVPAEDIFLDFAGFSTYESIYRARDVFCVSSMIVVTQKYHMFRALHICRSLGVAAEGFSSDQRRYTGSIYREAREVLARNKDAFKCLFKPEPTFLGKQYPIEGDGSTTHSLD